jgi:F-type H+-transporting ATPase subunit a
MSDPFSHVSDSSHWHVFENLDMGFHLPHVGGFQLTKFMVLELIAVGLILLIYIPLARKIRGGQPPKGTFWNFFEVFLTFIRDEVAKPNIQEPHHHHDDGHGHAHHDHGHEDHGHGHDHAAAVTAPGVHFSDKYVPFLWTVFLFILFNNLLGMIPFLGSPTGSFTVTVVLAIITFFYMHGSAVLRHGLVGYVKTYIPNVDAPPAISVLLVPMIFGIEVFGAFIKCFVLAVRLFANIFAGHLVLAFIMLFIYMARNQSMFLFWPVSIASVLGVIALSLLELFVAFLQAFVFTYLTAIFLGAVLNPEH